MPKAQVRPETALSRRLGHSFQNPALLEQALTHRSFGRDRGRGSAAADDAASLQDNERLEFLGDAVLGLRVCERLLTAFPAGSEGQLSRLRAWLVSSRNLAAVAQRLELGEHLRLSHAEEAIGGRSKSRLLANAMEAVIAAIHLDGGYSAAAAFIDRHFIGTSLECLSPDHLHEFAYKSVLQEWAHATGRALPVYSMRGASGPEHTKVFTVEVTLPGVFTGLGTGSSKKQAEQKAAGAALQFLGLL
ncbi:MAG: ribonuclease III [Terriglobales bacterium]